MGKVIQFFKERVWSALPADVPFRTRRTAAIAWPIFLLLLAGWIAWNRRRNGVEPGAAPVVLAVLAPLLAVLLIASASVGSRTYRGVMIVFMTIGFFVSHILMVFFFYAVVTPMGLLMRLMGKDLINRQPGKRPAWTPHRGHPERRRFFRLF
jgi:hypothetical protein